MNRRFFLKALVIFSLALIAYFNAIYFYLTPKINDYINQVQIENTKKQYNSIKKVLEKQLPDLKKKIIFDEIKPLKQNKDYKNPINSVILNVSIFFILIFVFMAIFFAYKIVVPLNKIFHSIHKLTNAEEEFDKRDVESLNWNFNSLFKSIQRNKTIIEEHVFKETKRIHKKLYYDELTNLKNRTSLEEEIKNKEFVSIVLIDIDSFDDINELYGFSTGNLVLIEVSKVLEEFALEYKIDTYRMYGNVFAYCDKDLMDFAKFNDFIDELSKLFTKRKIFLKDLEVEVSINITLGISLAQERPITTAGIALKKAKRNNYPYFVFNSEIDTKESIEDAIYWGEKIKIALKENNVIPFYQAIFDRNRKIVKYETLMRLKDTNQNGESTYISPVKFFNIAIKTKQYLALSTQVIFKALNDLKSTNRQLSFNISFKDILDYTFNDSLDEYLSTLKPEDKERVVFEILESDYIYDYSILEKFILKHKKQGIKIAIDDFGTGYSNFSHILKIRPNYIKIDGTLIKNIHKDKNSYEIVKSIISFCKVLNIKTVSEFVHCKEVYDVVYELGIDEFQGFYLGEPCQGLE